MNYIYFDYHGTTLAVNYLYKLGHEILPAPGKEASTQAKLKLMVIRMH